MLSQPGFTGIGLRAWSAEKYCTLVGYCRYDYHSGYDCCLPHAYLYAQLSLWKNGARHAASPDCMARITKELNMSDIGAITAYLALQPVPEKAEPAKPPF